MHSARRDQRSAFVRASGVAVAAVAMLFLAVGCSGTSGSTGPVGHATPSTTRKPAMTSAHGRLLLGLGARSRFVITDRGGQTLQTLTLAAIPGGPSDIATNPGAGWVVSFTPDPTAAYEMAPERLAVVDLKGGAVAFGPTFPADHPITALAVSPDGTRVALATMAATAQSPAGGIEIHALPGHTSASRSWALPPGRVNQVKSLSWAPDGRHLSYITGTQTGAGIAGPPSSLDTAASGRLVPTTSTWPTPVRKAGCSPDSVVWLAGTGRFAALFECQPALGEQFTEVTRETGAPLGVPVTVGDIGDVGCVDGAIHPGPDPSQILLTWCRRLYLVAHGTASALPGGLSQGAWAGTGPATR